LTNSTLARDEAQHGPHADADPAVQVCHAAHERRAQQVEHLREGVPEHVLGAAREVLGQPEHGRQEHQHLHDAGHDLGHVAVAGADEAQQQAERMRIDDKDQERGKDQQDRPRQRHARPEGHGDVQHDLVGELDQVARQASPDEQADRESTPVSGNWTIRQARCRHR
jgi:hypothetical protein